jgi:hypothetical protein
LGWSLDYQPPKEPELLNALFLAAGKALYLASSFEAKCQWVLRIVTIVTHYKATGDNSATTELARAMKEKMLGPTIRELKALTEFTAGDLETLERARDARNYIAHESAKLGPLSSASAKTITEKLAQLRVELQALIDGDNLVSRWIYEISEKEPAPSGIQQAYPSWVLEWVFEGTYGT